MKITADPMLSVFFILIGVGVIGVVAGGFLLWPSASVLLHGDRIMKSYYIPSESMRPTLEVNDYVRPLQVGQNGLARGQVVVFRGPENIRVARIAALGGDTIELRAGVVVVNGRSTVQHVLGPGPTVDGERTRLVQEQFAGEKTPHRLLDIDNAPFDTIDAVKVAPGTVYLLGDNRDRAADSRVPIADGGVGQIPVGAVLGIVDTVYWSATRERIGRPLDEVRRGS